MPSRSALPLLLLAALAAAFVLSYSALSAASVTPAPKPFNTVTTELPVAPTPAPKRKHGPRWRSVVIRGSVPLRESPNGRMVTRVGTRTEFGSTRVMNIAARHGRWLGVVSTEMPNGKLAWVHDKNAGIRFRRGAYSLHADLSGRRLELRRGGRLIRRVSVAIGRPGSETPTGRFAVTDKLRGGNYGPYYGCCILASERPPTEASGRLAGRQPDRNPRHQLARHDRLGRLRRMPSRCGFGPRSPDAPRAARHAGVHQELSF